MRWETIEINRKQRTTLRPRLVNLTLGLIEDRIEEHV